MIARNPGWVLDWLRGGRPALFKSLVRDSLVELRSHELPTSLADVAEMGPVSTLGMLGAPQELLYYLIRLSKPRCVLETGVFRGLSTAFILAGLSDNRAGQLHSIDLPSAKYTVTSSGNVYSSPLGSGEEPGFAIPNSLRERWTLHLGDSRKLMPELLAKLKTLDLFYHDSEHTYKMMTWEFETVLPSLASGGLLTSDDVQWNTAFVDFVHRNDFTWSSVVRNRLGIAQIR
jgi:predicted O-methyltransferase YrrM